MGEPTTGGRPSAIAAADAQTRPPRSSTASARARSPTRCGGGSRPDAQWTPRDGKSATCSSPRNHEAASATSRASASSASSTTRPRSSSSWRAASTSGRTGSETRARVGRAPGEFLQALLGAKPLDKAVENGTVHGDWPNRAFGRIAMVLARRPSRGSRRAPSYRAPYQPFSEATDTRVPVCGAWMKRPPPMYMPT